MFDHTDVLGSLALLSYIGVGASETTLVVFSDLRQNFKELDFERAPTIQVDVALERLKKARSIPALPRTRVFLLGVDPTGKSTAYFASLKEFWIRLFAEAGATVETFSLARRIPVVRTGR
jgi:hypothetical protein